VYTMNTGYSTEMSPLYGAKSESVQDLKTRNTGEIDGRKIFGHNVLLTIRASLPPNFIIQHRF
jgi:hypothetical protein